MQYKARVPAHVIVWDLETVPDLRGFWITADFKNRPASKPASSQLPLLS
jgi:hypothetical protein